MSVAYDIRYEAPEYAQMGCHGVYTDIWRYEPINIRACRRTDQPNADRTLEFCLVLGSLSGSV